MKILVLVGTRPELIRLSEIIRKLNTCCECILIDTKQNKQNNMSNVFYKQLQIQKPNYTLKNKTTTLGSQLNSMFNSLEKIINKEKPDKALILGDTNTALCTILLERMGISVYHMEAGNRCFDKKVPEEINRKLIDSISSYNMPYTKNSKENLLHDGIPLNKIFVCGNPIYEIINKNKKAIMKTTMNTFNPYKKNYILVTCHRAETINNFNRFNNVFKALNILSKEYEIIYPIHPHAKQKLKEFKINTNINIINPLGFFEFSFLEYFASIIITDSGTVQEEACILKVPAVIIRDSTERPETIECGATIISGLEPKTIINCVQYMKNKKIYNIPEEYLYKDVSNKVINYILGKQI